MSSLAISESDKMSTATLINRRIAGGFDLFMMSKYVFINNTHFSLHLRLLFKIILIIQIWALCFQE